MDPNYTLGARRPPKRAGPLAAEARLASTVLEGRERGNT